MRDYDKKTFRLKYPLATIHMLIGLLENKLDIEVTETAIFPLLFTDGTFNVMFKYPENVMNWWKYLRVEDNEKLLHHVFMGDNYTVHKLMLEMDKFFKKRDQISVTGERGDRLKISDKYSSPYNIESSNGRYKINDDAKDRCEKFVQLLSMHTNWEYKESSWNFDNLNLMRFTKSDFKGKDWTVKKVNCRKLWELDPLSWAMTSMDNIEFTEEKPDKLI